MTNPDVHTRAGMFGGIVYGLFIQIKMVDISTIINTAIVTIVSFVTAHALKHLWKWLTRKPT